MMSNTTDMLAGPIELTSEQAEMVGGGKLSFSTIFADAGIGAGIGGAIGGGLGGAIGAVGGAIVGFLSGLF